MKKSHFTEQQIAFAIPQAETGTPVPELCRKMRHGGSNLLPMEATLWRSHAL